ncbi:hypothetical protein EKK58_06780 [Candidatus Dependentiae bacterium]|nr:MAG: hypothetical protein EKK58_06780 [Candidatus Dependentiae bacterium]
MNSSEIKQYEKDWISFLQHDMQTLQSCVVLLIYEKEYPLSFISYYLQKRKYALTTIDLTEMHNCSDTMLDQLFATTFLGQPRIYLIKNAWDELTSVQQKFFIRLANSYVGPHYCIIPIERSAVVGMNHKQACKIALPSMCNMQEIILFAKQECVSFPIFQKLLTSVFQKSASISFDMVMVLFNYASVISTNAIDEFTECMMPVLLNNKQSLYDLSGAFFAKKSSFFAMWRAIEPMYSIQFWIVFWSDQLMKAAFFIAYKKNGSLQQAKEIGIGLPFSFLNKDWHLYSPQKLVDGYTFLYECDYRFKDNALIKSLDTFFIIFFNKQFD